MTNITRRALRVYSALNELSGPDADILDSLIPFFEPVLEILNGTVFDPHVFAAGIKRLYKWRFTGDVAIHFIPRLQAKGYLERAVNTHQSAVYIVRYQRPPDDSGDAPIAGIVNAIIDEFEHFPARVTDLLSYNRTREELEDVLIRFLVSMDAPGQGAFAPELGNMEPVGEAYNLVSRLEEGGNPLNHNDRYMCARFVRHLMKNRRHYVPHLTRLASIGLLTEVVEDFLKPTSSQLESDLTIFFDAPLALDFLGCSGKDLKEDIRSVVNALTAIGCKFAIFDVSCDEMTRNLGSMLALPLDRRHGYTHQAVIRREVDLDFVQAVARHPDKALTEAGITVRNLSLEQYPYMQKFFTGEQYESFFQSISWVAQVEPREHDATCAALIMRLREGRQNSDIFRCKYALVTRNARYVRHARAYCLEGRMISRQQEGPVITQRELATIAWLRTGLGGDATIPRGYLISTCDRILRIRPEVRHALATQLALITPERLEQFNVLMLDARSVRKLADETLNDESVVSAENAQRLLDVIRTATAEEEREKFEAKLASETAESEMRYLALEKINLEQTEAPKSSYAAILSRKNDDGRKLLEIINNTNSICYSIDTISIVIIVVLAFFGIIEFFTKAFSPYGFWQLVALPAGAFGLYRLVCAVLERPSKGLTTLLNMFARARYLKGLNAANLDKQFNLDDVDISDGRIKLK